mgnify:CR=1 FL=1
MPDLNTIDWVSLFATLAALALVWAVVRAVLKFTARVFACGCAVIGGLVLAGFAVLYWDRLLALWG